MEIVIKNDSIEIKSNHLETLILKFVINKENIFHSPDNIISIEILSNNISLEFLNNKIFFHIKKLSLLLLPEDLSYLINCIELKCNTQENIKYPPNLKFLQIEKLNKIFTDLRKTKIETIYINDILDYDQIYNFFLLPETFLKFDAKFIFDKEKYKIGGNIERFANVKKFKKYLNKIKKDVLIYENNDVIYSCKGYFKREIKDKVISEMTNEIFKNKKEYIIYHSNNIWTINFCKIDCNNKFQKIENCYRIKM